MTDPTLPDYLQLVGVAPQEDGGLLIFVRATDEDLLEASRAYQQVIDLIPLLEHAKSNIDFFIREARAAHMRSQIALASDNGGKPPHA